MHVPWMSIDKQPQVYAAHLLLMRDFNEALNAMTSEKSHEAWMLFAQVKLGHMWMVGLALYVFRCSGVSYVGRVWGHHVLWVWCDEN